MPVLSYPPVAAEMPEIDLSEIENAISDLSTALAGKASLEHSHSIDQVDDLVDVLESKADANAVGTPQQQTLNANAITNGSINLASGTRLVINGNANLDIQAAINQSSLLDGMEVEVYFTAASSNRTVSVTTYKNNLSNTITVPTNRCAFMIINKIGSTVHWFLRDIS